MFGTAIHPYRIDKNKTCYATGNTDYTREPTFALSTKNTDHLFDDLTCIVADEWHELLGTKRGVLVELALSRIKGIIRSRTDRTLRIWGISATIGNLEEALEVLQPDHMVPKTIVKADAEKKIRIQSIIPDTIEMLPWAGHLGIKLADKLIPIIKKVKPL